MVIYLPEKESWNPDPTRLEKRESKYNKFLMVLFKERRRYNGHESKDINSWGDRLIDKWPIKKTRDNLWGKSTLVEEEEGQ